MVVSPIAYLGPIVDEKEMLRRRGEGMERRRLRQLEPCNEGAVKTIPSEELSRQRDSVNPPLSNSLNESRASFKVSCSMT